MALYNHHPTEAVIVEVSTRGRYLLEYCTHDQKKIREWTAERKGNRVKRVGETVSVYYKPGESGLFLADLIKLSWFVWGIFILFFILELLDKIGIKFNNLFVPKPSKVWGFYLADNTTKTNEQLEIAYSKIEYIVKGYDNPAKTNFSALFVDVLNNILDGGVHLQKGNKLMQCQLVDPDLRVFRTEYCMGDISMENPLYSTKYNETAEITAKLLESFYLENNDYLHEARWEISDWFKEQYLQ